MLYYLRVLEAIGVKNNNEGNSSNKDNYNGGGDLKDIEPDLQFEDYKKLVKFNAKQK
jgi:hypothetical protein